MRTFATLACTLAALSQCAFAAFKEGTYTIGSAALDSQLLTDVAADEPVVFQDADGTPPQTWFFAPDQVVKDAFTITSTLGGSLNCGEAEGSVCVAGSNETQVYTPEKVSNTAYQLVSRDSGYFLRAENGQLVVAGWDQTPEEEFILTQA
ncbi:hypothetical protein N7478_007072 [Penicillium angulare]|uniref:uncharacterized protein n=1 Tax=Penicillium angulare TaxID=116970 RepID=UPI002540E755|nr:uncharacterized protein N7478_007072 [Penicillium angulare]KAJ5281700.1 hypothetical protein N7478_007072 [Penicillium angulare]